MKRSNFLTNLGLVTTGLVVAPNRILGQDNRPDAYQKDIVQQFVGASHGNFEKVKELLAEYPNLIYSSNDWGGGDFETGIGACGHTGRKDIVEHLLDQGARPTLHVLTMLGKTELVKPILEEYPQLLTSLGPHGFTYYHHALKGGDEANDLKLYFESKGLTETQISLYKKS